MTGTEGRRIMTDMSNTMVVRPVLAGAYKSPIKSTLTHAVDLGADGNGWTVQCESVKEDSVSDDAMSNENGPPTCKVCLRKWLKAQG